MWGRPMVPRRVAHGVAGRVAGMTLPGGPPIGGGPATNGTPREISLPAPALAAGTDPSAGGSAPAVDVKKFRRAEMVL